MLRSGTSVAANFREASRARSDAEFVAKLGIVEQELDESLLWLELLEDGKVFEPHKLASLKHETEELIKIVVTAIRNTKRNK